MSNAINWFEIPVTDFKRALKFYETVLASQLHQEKMGEFEMGFFTHQGNGVGGAICKVEGCVPSQNGVTIYLNGGEDLTPFIERVEAAGGTVIMPKTKITDEIGYMAMFLDTEGNKVAFHSPK